MSSNNFAYVGLGVAFLFIAVGALAFGLWGLYTIGTGGTGEVESDGVDIDSLECTDEAFAGDPAFPGDPPHEIDRSILSPNEVESVNATTTDGEYILELSMEGSLLDAWAVYEDGAELPVEVTENAVTVTTQSQDPYRLWIDSAGDGITRTELTLCPANY